jgi:hypothetical protein
MKKIILQHEILNQCPVFLYQTRAGGELVQRFAVEYGAEYHTGLSYSEAAMQYGCCLMHAAACDGRIKE